MMQPRNVLGMLQPPYHTAAGHYEVYVTHTRVHWGCTPRGDTLHGAIHRPPAPLVEPGSRNTSNSAQRAKSALLQLPYHSQNHAAPLAGAWLPITTSPQAQSWEPLEPPKRCRPGRPMPPTPAPRRRQPPHANGNTTANTKMPPKTTALGRSGDTR